MSQIAKSILLLSIVMGNMLNSFADRGLRKRSKNKVILNISTAKTFKNSLSFNLTTGLKYKEAIYIGEKIENGFKIANSLQTYQKGNTIYLLPSKHKIITPEVKQGYTGMKLIIKAKN